MTEDPLTRLLVLLGECVRAFELGPGRDEPEGYDAILVIIPTLTLGDVRRAYPALHRLLLGREPPEL